MQATMPLIIALLALSSPDYDRSARAVTESYASAHFCDRPAPKGEPGSISIWWERDASGRCTVQKAKMN